MTRWSVPSWRLALFCGFLLLIAGCSESDERALCRPQVPAGRIEGTVRMGMAVANLVITATRVPAGEQSTFVGEAAPDTTGRYHVDVPAGRYVVAIWVKGRRYYSFSRTGLKYGGEPGDTLRIDEEQSVPEVDFDLAVVRVRVAVPSQLNDRGGMVRLVRRGDDEPGSRYLPADQGSGRIQNGQLEIVVPCVIPGLYKMEMDIGYEDYLCDNCIYEGERFWLPSTRDSSQTDWTEVPVGRITDAIGSIDANPARVEGEVIGAWQVLGIYDRPRISLFSLDSTLVMGPRTVGAHGAFGVDILLPCPVKVSVTEDGFEQWMGGASFHEARTYALEHGQTVTGVRLVQSGLAVDLSPDSASFELDEADVRLYDGASGVQLGKFSPSTMGGEHRLGIANLRPGTYLLWIGRIHWWSGDWMPQWFDRSPTQAGAQAITIANDGDVVPVHVTFDIGGRITGTITDASNPGARYLVYFTPADDQAQADWGFDYNGAFSLHGLSDGGYKIGVWRQADRQYPDQPPSGTIWYPGTADWSAAQTITIRDHEVVTGIDIVMSR